MWAGSKNHESPDYSESLGRNTNRSRLSRSWAAILAIPSDITVADVALRTSIPVSAPYCSYTVRHLQKIYCRDKQSHVHNFTSECKSGCSNWSLCLFLVLCIWVLCLCASLHTTCLAQRPDNCKPPCWCRESNPNPLQEQQALSDTELCQSLTGLFKKSCQKI